MRGLARPSQVRELLDLVEQELGRHDEPGYRVAPWMLSTRPELGAFWAERVVRYLASLTARPPAALRLLNTCAFVVGPQTDERTMWHQEAATSANPFGPPLFGAWLALTDASARRAPLMVVPGSHVDPIPTFGASAASHGYEPHPDFDQVKIVPEEDAAFADTVPIEARAGDIVMFDGWLTHACRENTDDRPRVAVTARFQGRAT